MFASRAGSPLSWLLVVLLALGAAAAGPERIRISALALLAAAFWTVVLARTLAGPSYNPAGIYLPLIFAGGFLVSCRENSVFRAAVAFGIAIAVWGLFQVLSGLETRASAYFETSNSYAGLLSALAAPVALAMAIRPTLARAGVLALLAAAILASQSRGAGMALLVGTTAAAVMGWVVGARVTRRGMALTVLAMATGCVLFMGAANLLPRGTAGASAPAITPPERRDSVDSRFELYRTSLEAWRDAPVFGTGYLSFPYTLEASREKVPSYAGAQTYFVHNDYLQILQETGVVGLLALLAMLAAPFVAFLRKRSAENALPGAMALGGISALAAHALVDFPLYIPACVLLLGGLIGSIARCADDEAQAAPTRSPVRFLVRVLAVTGVVCLVSPPAIAQLADQAAERAIRSGDMRSGLYWYTVARNFQPQDWRYRWVLGRLWTDQAMFARSREFAAFAEEEFRAGMRTNPLEPSNLLGLIQLNRRAAGLLGTPASRADLDRWSLEALRLAPKATAVRRERILVLAHLHRRAEASEEAQRWVKEEPHNLTAVQLAERFRPKPWPQSER